MPELARLGALLAAATLAGGSAATAESLTFVPLPPCRVIDTRIAGGLLAANTERSFEVSGTANFEAQGGTAGGCGVPQDFLFPSFAVAINLIAVNPLGPGNLRAWREGDPTPAASVLNYSNVAGLNIANGVILPIVGSNVLPKDLRIRADVSGTHVVADVTGYFTLPYTISGSPTSNAVDLSDGECHPVVSCSVNGPSSFVVVTVVARFNAAHVGGIRDALHLTIRSSVQADPCLDDHKASRHALPASLPSDNNYVFTLTAQQLFVHPGGQRNYTASARWTSGANAGDSFTSGDIICRMDRQ